MFMWRTALSQNPGARNALVEQSDADEYVICGFFSYCRFRGFLCKIPKISPEKTSIYGAFGYVITYTALLFNLTRLAKFPLLADNILFARFKRLHGSQAMKIPLFQQLSIWPMRDKSCFAGLAVSRYSSDSHWFKIWISGLRKLCWFVTLWSAGSGPVLSSI
jgi:hypothetical protein